jgi:hypothetical protein
VRGVGSRAKRRAAGKCYRLRKSYGRRPPPYPPPQAGEELRLHIVMAGLVPAIHVFAWTHT